MAKEAVAGIDLGTTNSEIALVRDGRVQVIEWEGTGIMPSVVGFDPEGRLLVGEEAKNQLLAYPERTVRSIKRRMGTGDSVEIGDWELTPPEVSALILKELVRRAGEVTGLEIRKAVITVPAYFSDAQRQATRAAGEIAGLEVLRLINEPTAASLAYGAKGAGGRGGEGLYLVYDLGGGTFDVSIVQVGKDVTEVLASHGDVRLGGDDFDRLLAEELVRPLRKQGLDPSKDSVLWARLMDAAEKARRKLSDHVYTKVSEEFLGRKASGEAVHLEREVTRRELEDLIRPLVEKSLESVHEALKSAGKKISEISDVLLVGGVTRTPLIQERLEDLFGKAPRRDLHPDLCVAQGAALHAARLAGTSGGRVLVDVTPYSFGPSCLGELEGEVVPYFYVPVIRKGTPLPVTREESFKTVYDNQEKWDVQIYQGESRDARRNILVGRFMASGFSRVPWGNEILCRMSLDLDGILSVEVVEKRTGLSKTVTIEGVLEEFQGERLARARARTEALWRESGMGIGPEGNPLPEPGPREEPGEEDWKEVALRMLERGRALKDKMAAEDWEEFREMAADLEEALEKGDREAVRALAAELEDLVHYVEEV